MVFIKMKVSLKKKRLKYFMSLRKILPRLQNYFKTIEEN